MLWMWLRGRWAALQAWCATVEAEDDSDDDRYPLPW